MFRWQNVFASWMAQRRLPWIVCKIMNTNAWNELLRKYWNRFLVSYSIYSEGEHRRIVAGRGFRHIPLSFRCQNKFCSGLSTRQHNLIANHNLWENLCKNDKPDYYNIVRCRHSALLEKSPSPNFNYNHCSQQCQWLHAIESSIHPEVQFNIAETLHGFRMHFCCCCCLSAAAARATIR